TASPSRRRSTWSISTTRYSFALKRRCGSPSADISFKLPAMKILVTCKRVPNPEQKLKIGAGKIDLGGASWQINTFDEYAVETALRLTEKGKGGERSGEVVVVSIGPKD